MARPPPESRRPPPAALSRPVSVSRPAHSEQRAAATGGSPSQHVFPSRSAGLLSSELLSRLQADTRRVRVTVRWDPVRRHVTSEGVTASRSGSSSHHSVTQRPIPAGGEVWCQGRPRAQQSAAEGQVERTAGVAVAHQRRTATTAVSATSEPHEHCGSPSQLWREQVPVIRPADPDSNPPSSTSR